MPAVFVVCLLCFCFYVASGDQQTVLMSGHPLFLLRWACAEQVYTESIGRLWVPPPNEEDEMVRLMDYLRIRNLRLSRNTSRLGFIYHHYSEHAW